LLKNCKSNEWERLSPHASAILYRFWHKEKEGVMTPAHFGEWVTQNEDWPIEGEFYPTLTLIDHSVHIEVDYLSLPEMPLLADVDRASDRWQLDRTYHEWTTRYRKDNRFDRSDTLEAAVSNSKIVLEDCISSLHQLNPTEGQVGTVAEWHDFWLDQWKLMARPEGLSTDILLDNYINKVRAKWRGYGMTSDELTKLSKTRKKPSKRVLQDYKAQYYFWMLLSMTLIYPLTSYLGLISPLFIDQQMWEEDVLALTKKVFRDPMPIYGPCTNLTLTNFGRLVAMSYQIIPEKEIRV